MAIAFVVSGTERSSIESNVPTTSEISAAMRLVARGTFPAGGGTTRSRTIFQGNWVGPSPRIVRSAPVGAFVTQVTWVWALDDAQQATSRLTTSVAQQAFMDHLRDDVHLALRLGATHGTIAGDDWTVEVIPHADAINGPLAWWRSGAAARGAVFVDNFPALVSRGAPTDNPIGPNNPLAQGAGGGGNGGGGVADTLGTLITGAAVITVAGAVSVATVKVFGPLLSAFLSDPRTRAPAKANARRAAR